MSDWLDKPIAVPQPFVVNSEPLRFPAPQPPDWWQRALMFAPWVLLVMVLAWLWMRPGGNPDEDDTVRVDGLRVLIIEESADRAKLTPEQTAIFNSVILREAIAKRDGDLLILDADDDTRRLDKTWQALEQRVDLKPPCVVFAAKNRALHFALPDNVETFVKKLESFAK